MAQMGQTRPDAGAVRARGEAGGESGSESASVNAVEAERPSPALTRGLGAGGAR